MRTVKLVGTTAAAGIALAMLSAPSALAAPTAPAAPIAKAAAVTDTVKIQKRDFIYCGKGKGGKKRVNFSWKKGDNSTTVYFNNHCTKGKRIPATVQARAKHGTKGWVYQYKCLTTKGKTDGKKKFSTGRWTIHNISGKSKYCKK
ncbi:hypothetical protein [Actinomadura sp. 6N118]|uniref:hypothetical protein n=1 Tax=Actinomadura sp. 6N118 TaxID=3375151 RepID=UPI003791F193